MARNCAGAWLTTMAPACPNRALSNAAVSRRNPDRNGHIQRLTVAAGLKLLLANGFADALRDELPAMGNAIKDGPDGTTWTRIVE